MNDLHYYCGNRLLWGAKGCDVYVEATFNLKPVTKHRLEKLLRAGRPVEQAKSGRLGWLYELCTEVLGIPVFRLSYDWTFNRTEQRYVPSARFRVRFKPEAEVYGLDMERLHYNLKSATGMAYVMDVKHETNREREHAGQEWHGFVRPADSNSQITDLTSMMETLAKTTMDGVFLEDFTLPDQVRFSTEMLGDDYYAKTKYERDVALPDNYAFNRRT